MGKLGLQSCKDQRYTETPPLPLVSKYITVDWKTLSLKEPEIKLQGKLEGVYGVRTTMENSQMAPVCMLHV